MTASNDTKALLYPFEQGRVRLPAKGGKVLFINAAYDESLKPSLGTVALTCLQHDFVLAKQLKQAGLDATPDWPDEKQLYDFVLIRLPKQRDQAHYFMAKGLSYLAKSGMLLCAAANDAGGGRIEKDLRSVIGQNMCHALSKHKAKVVWSDIKNRSFLQGDILSRWEEQGRLQKYNGHGFWTQAGIFGWDKIDRGSNVLIRNLPETLAGYGADFGCGYGFLSSYILKNCSGTAELYCIDSDINAIRAARKNLSGCGDETLRIDYIWDDLTGMEHGLPMLDWIVMNPPFHHHKKQDSDIGLQFIETAAKFLRRGGMLWMVANIHLPYEKRLEALFSRYSCIAEQDGFKVFCAIK